MTTIIKMTEKKVEEEEGALEIGKTGAEAEEGREEEVIEAEVIEVGEIGVEVIEAEEIGEEVIGVEAEGTSTNGIKMRTIVQMVEKVWRERRALRKFASQMNIDEY